LGAASAAPGDQVEVPLRLEAGSGVEVGAAATSIRFDSSALEFLEVQPGDSLAQIKGSAVVRESAVSDRESVLKVGLVTYDPAHFGSPIPNGVLAWIVFRVRQDAIPGVLLLEHSAELSTASVPAESLGEVRAVAGEIRVEKSPAKK
jgi:hypothetical protein